MPSKAKKECAWPGCHKTVSTKHCDQHTQITVELNRFRNRSPQNKLYKTSRWRAQRQRVIARDKGICQLCKNPVIGSYDSHVDHIEAVQDTGKFWVKDIQLQLTHRLCHSKKTMEERRNRGDQSI